MADTLGTSKPAMLDPGPFVGSLLINYGSDQTWNGIARGFFLTTAGTLKVDFADGSTATLATLSAGVEYHFAIVKIYSSGSSSAAGYVLF